MSPHNPYAAPDAKLADPAAGPGSAFKAVSLGLVADIGGSVGVSLVLALGYGVVLGISGASQEEIEAATVATDSWFFYLTTLVGFGFSVLGGYVCARIAKRSEYKLAAVLAVISVLLGLGFTFAQYSVLMNLVLAIAGVAAVMLGARLGYARNKQGSVN